MAQRHESETTRAVCKIRHTQILVGNQYFHRQRTRLKITREHPPIGSMCVRGEINANAFERRPHKRCARIACLAQCGGVNQVYMPRHRPNARGRIPEAIPYRWLHASICKCPPAGKVPEICFMPKGAAQSVPSKRNRLPLPEEQPRSLLNANKPSD